METYPAGWPLPRFSPYSYVADSGLIRPPMSGGFARQRRLYDVRPQTWKGVQFAIPAALFYLWSEWINSYGFEFFTIPLASRLSAQAGRPVADTIVRITSDLAIELQENAVYIVTVDLEQSPVQASNYAPPPGGNWIIGGRPPAPSADNVIGGRPASPAPDWIIAGRPGSPSRRPVRSWATGRPRKACPC